MKALINNMHMNTKPDTIAAHSIFSESRIIKITVMCT